MVQNEVLEVATFLWLRSYVFEVFAHGHHEELLVVHLLHLFVVDKLLNLSVDYVFEELVVEDGNFFFSPLLRALEFAHLNEHSLFIELQHFAGDLLDFGEFLQNQGHQGLLLAFTQMFVFVDLSVLEFLVQDSHLFQIFGIDVEAVLIEVVLGDEVDLEGVQDLSVQQRLLLDQNFLVPEISLFVWMFDEVFLQQNVVEDLVEGLSVVSMRAFNLRLGNRQVVLLPLTREEARKHELKFFLLIHLLRLFVGHEVQELLEEDRERALVGLLQNLDAFGVISLQLVQ